MKKLPPDNKPVKTKKKWDFALEKGLFFASPIDEVKAYFLHKYGIYSKTVVLATAGWTAEKKKHKQDLADKALADLKTKEAKEIAKFLNNVWTGLKMKAGTVGELKKRSVKDLRQMWEIAMTASGKPVRIHHNINDNQNPIPVSISDKTKELVEKYKKADKARVDGKRKTK